MAVTVAGETTSLAKAAPRQAADTSTDRVENGGTHASFELESHDVVSRTLLCGLVRAVCFVRARGPEDAAHGAVPGNHASWIPVAEPRELRAQLVESFLYGAYA